MPRAIHPELGQRQDGTGTLERCTSRGRVADWQRATGAGRSLRPHVRPRLLDAPFDIRAKGPREAGGKHILARPYGDLAVAWCDTLALLHPLPQQKTSTHL